MPFRMGCTPEAPADFESDPEVLYSAAVESRVAMKDVVDNLRTYIASEYLNMPPGDLPPDHPLVSNGLIDSFNLVDLALYIEENFGVHIEDTELNATVFDTVDQLAALIRARS